jgi:hypothetical protein
MSLRSLEAPIANVVMEEAMPAVVRTFVDTIEALYPTALPASRTWEARPFDYPGHSAATVLRVTFDVPEVTW